jgi:hypothetical protein
VSLRGWVKRIERAAKDELESFELLDGSRYYYDPIEAAKELFLFGIDCYKSDSISEWPEPPDIYARVCEARDQADVLEQVVPSDKAAWFIDLPYDRNVLSSERRLEPASIEPVEDLSE